MNLSQHFLQAIFVLKNNKLRSFLSTLGILIGGASIVALLSIGNMTTSHMLKSFKSLDQGFVRVGLYPKNSDANNEIDLDSKEFKELMSMPYVDDVALMTQPAFLELVVGDKSIVANVVGAGAAVESILDFSLEKGRFITSLDNYQNNIVLGHEIASIIQKNTSNDILNTKVKIGRNYFNVVGVLKKTGKDMLFGNIDKYAITSVSTIQLFDNMRSSPASILFKSSGDTEQSRIDLENHIKLLLGHRFDMDFFSSSAIKQKIKEQTDLVSAFLLFIASISALVGGIGVMNIMLVSIVERKQEIGLRLAIGAKPSDVIMLFLVESVVMGIFGGVIGVILGITCSYIFSIMTSITFSFYLTPCLLGFSVSTLTTFIFGLFPAYRASKLTPISTLRS